jgi:DNA-binding NarL/FixJ family response regulator
MSIMSPSSGVVKVAIIEDQQVLREGLAYLLDSTEGFSCSGCFGSVEQALKGINHDLPQVVLVDIGLPGINGIEGIRLLKRRWPELLLITLTVYEDDQKIFDALCAGASGYLLKQTPLARLVECLKEVVAGGAPMSPEVARRVVRIFVLRSGQITT